MISGGQAAAQSADGGQVQEVIVTAQRIAQPASKTPLSLSVLSGDDLKAAGAVNAASLTDMAPNVQINSYNGSTIISIRGVHSADTTEKGDPSASFNIDGINLARPQSAGLAFYDLERVEVLRGPQGTLYGRNSTAGAINLITNKPVDKFEARGAIELGNYHGVKFDGMLNSKISDVLSVRGAVSSSQHDGYLRSTQGFRRNFDDDDSLSGRLQALFKFNPDMSLLLSADASTVKGAGPGNVPYATFIGNTGDAQRTASPSVAGFVDHRARGMGAEFKARLGVGELTYQAAHRVFDRSEDVPWGQAAAGVAPADYRAIAQYTQNSHELRLASSFGDWRTIAGLFYFKEDSNIDTKIRNYPVLKLLAFHQDPVISESKALYGEATYSVSPDLRLTAGARTTHDEKSRVGLTQRGNSITQNDASVSYAKSTGKLGADYSWSKQVMLYATYSTGYKAGGFNDGTSASNPFLIYNPEQLAAIEVGAKGRFFANRLQLNASAFQYDYKDLQLTSVAIDPATGAIGSQTRNAAKAAITGAELEGKFAISTAGKFDFSAADLDAHFKSYVPKLGADWSGMRLEKAPRLTLALGYTHNWYLENGGALSAHIGSRHSASYVINDNANAAQFTQKAFYKSDFNLSYSPSGTRWSVQGYVRNIGNETVMTGYAGASGGRPATVTLAPPRTMGVRLLAEI
nr:TonB-dependent receptor [uncultured Duganella sp.]